MKNWKKYLKVIFYIILFIGLVFLSILIEEKEHILKYFNNIDKISNVFTNFIIGIIITYVISQIIKYKKYFSLLWATQKLSIIIVILLSIGILYSPCIKNNELTKLLGSIIAIVIGLFIYRAQRRILPWDVLKRLNCEFKEITRHLERNFEVLESIQTTKGIPSLIHIKKLKIDDHTTLTDSDILKNIPSSLTSKIYPMTIRIRNYNITVQCLERAIKFKNATLFDKYLQEIKIITKVLQKDIYNYIIEIQEKLPKIENENKTDIKDKYVWGENILKKIDDIKDDINKIQQNIDNKQEKDTTKETINKKSILEKINEIKDDINKIQQNTNNEQNLQKEDQNDDNSLIKEIKEIKEDLEKIKKQIPQEEDKEKNILKEIIEIQIDLKEIKKQKLTKNDIKEENFSKKHIDEKVKDIEIDIHKIKKQEQDGQQEKKLKNIIYDQNEWEN